MHFQNEIKYGFAEELRQHARVFLEQQNDHPFANWAVALKGTGLVMCFIAGYIAILSDNLSPIACLLAAIVCGLSALLLAINIGHDAAHDVLTPWPVLNHILQRICFTLLGVDSYLWRYRHTKSHHIFPNVNGCDIDIDENPFLRLSPNQPLRRYFRYQHWYAPLVYCLVVFHTVFIQDFMYLYQKKLANIKRVCHPRSAHLMFYFSKLMYLTLVFILPLALTSLSLWQVLLGYTMVSAIVSVAFIILLVGTHFSTFTSFPTLNQNGQLNHSWAVHCLETSQDWNPGSTLAAFITGGANCHAAHHLFPRLSHRHYRRMHPLIESLAVKYQVRYNKSNLRTMIVSHFKFLRQMSR